MQKVSIIGLDIAKNTFHAHGAGADGSVLLRKALPRSCVLEFLARIAPCAVAMEACSGAHYWGRKIRALGHEVRLLAPRYVKPYVSDRKTMLQTLRRSRKPHRGRR
jgi:transposase